MLNFDFKYGGIKPYEQKHKRAEKQPFNKLLGEMHLDGIKTINIKPKEEVRYEFPHHSYYKKGANINKYDLDFLKPTPHFRYRPEDIVEVDEDEILDNFHQDKAGINVEYTAIKPMSFRETQINNMREEQGIPNKLTALRVEAEQNIPLQEYMKEAIEVDNKFQDDIQNIINEKHIDETGKKLIIDLSKDMKRDLLRNPNLHKNLDSHIENNYKDRVEEVKKLEKARDKTLVDVKRASELLKPLNDEEKEELKEYYEEMKHLKEQRKLREENKSSLKNDDNIDDGSDSKLKRPKKVPKTISSKLIDEILAEEEKDADQKKEAETVLEELINDAVSKLNNNRESKKKSTEYKKIVEEINEKLENSNISMNDVNANKDREEPKLKAGAEEVEPIIEIPEPYLNIEVVKELYDKILDSNNEKEREKINKEMNKIIYQIEGYRQIYNKYKEDYIEETYPTDKKTRGQIQIAVNDMRKIAGMPKIKGEYNWKTFDEAMQSIEPIFNPQSK